MPTLWLFRNSLDERWTSTISPYDNYYGTLCNLEKMKFKHTLKFKTYKFLSLVDKVNTHIGGPLKTKQLVICNHVYCLALSSPICTSALYFLMFKGKKTMCLDKTKFQHLNN